MEPAVRPILFHSAEERTALIELFTSEGCSSCPVADRWLGGLSTSGRLWKDFVPVAWHVDYWDGLGWVDALASPGNTRRQETYVKLWHARSPYTPGLVVNGREWRDWSPSESVPALDGTRVGVLDLKATAAGEFEVSFRPGSKRLETDSRESLEVTIAWLGNGLESAVRRGENSGKTLRHSFVVLSSITGPLAPSKGADGGWSARINFPLPSVKAKQRAVAAWVSKAGNPSPVQVVGGVWPNP